MARLKLAVPCLGDIRHIARNLRVQDVDELIAIYGLSLDIERILVAAVQASEECMVAVKPDTGEPVALFGVSPLSLIGGTGCPWMLGTDGLIGHQRDIVVLGKKAVAEWGKRYDMLYNYVDARNTRAISWLRHIGFVIFKPEPHGQFRLPFHRFERCA